MFHTLSDLVLRVSSSTWLVERDPSRFLEAAPFASVASDSAATLVGSTINSSQNSAYCLRLLRCDSPHVFVSLDRCPRSIFQVRALSEYTSPGRHSGTPPSASFLSAFKSITSAD